MNAPGESPVAQALRLTHDMLAAAKAQDWDLLATLEAQRDPLLHREHTADSVDALRDILTCDQELRTLVSQARDQAAAQWQRGNQGAKAVKAYAQA